MNQPPNPEQLAREIAEKLNYKLQGRYTNLITIEQYAEIIQSAITPLCKENEELRRINIDYSIAISKCIFALRKFRPVRQQMLSKTVSGTAFDDAVQAVEGLNKGF